MFLVQGVFNRFRSSRLNMLVGISALLATVSCLRNLASEFGSQYWNPAIACQEAEWNAGEIRDQKVIEHVFELKNVGRQPLTVSRILTDCSCIWTVGSELPKTVPPEGEFPLPTRVNLGGLNGAFKKRVYVYSNDCRQPMFMLSIRGTVVSTPSAAASP
ncbi:MAG: hypothetical protein JWP89_1123 [Schlesneria sp.]|nr:hypothetical protein [Schlesneria sp.]